MAKETIEVFTYNIRRKKGRSNLSFSRGSDIYSILKNGFTNFVDQVKTGPVNPAEKRTVRIPASEGGVTFWGHKDNYRCVYGILESGIYGKRLEVVDKDNPRQVLYTSANDSAAVIKPFFFLICAPRIGDTGFIILERTDNEGVFNLFNILLYSFLEAKLSYDNHVQEYSIKHQNYLSHDYIENLKNGTIKSVRLTVNSLPKDLAERYMLEGLLENANMSIVINFRNGLLSNSRIARAIKDNSSLFSTDADSLNELFNGSQRSIVTSSRIGGATKERTVYLSEESQRLIRPYYLIDVSLNEKGYPCFESICDAVFAFIDSNPDLKQLTI